MALHQQQQEIIKLLTQHFHQQFYQLASGNQYPISGQQQNPQHAHLPINLQHSNLASSSSSSSTSASSDLNSTTTSYIRKQNLKIHHHEQALHTNPNSIDLTSTIDTNNLNHLNFMRSQLVTKPQQHNNQSNESLSIVVNERSINDQMNTILNTGSSAQNSFYDMDILNAFGLNLATNFSGSNNPFISPHHLALIQAAAANGHYGSLLNVPARSETPISGMANQNIGYGTGIGSSPNMSADSEAERDINNRSNAIIDRGLSKFSINNILGQARSPNLEDRSNMMIKNSGDRSSFMNQFNRFPDSRDIGSNPSKVGLADCDMGQISSPSTDSDDSSPGQSIESRSSILTNSNASVFLNTNNEHLINSANITVDDGTANRGSDLSTKAHETTVSIVGNNINNIGSTSVPSTSVPLRGSKFNQPRHQQFNPFMTAGTAAFPWTVASRGKPRRGMMRRAVFSDNQRIGLEKRFQLQKYISKPDRKKLAEKLGLRDSQVKIWFQNRRMKWRNSKERELLSTGGSREQTLPTRNNPNPDLSDVGETVKKQNSVQPVTTTTTSSSKSCDLNEALPDTEIIEGTD